MDRESNRDGNERLDCRNFENRMEDALHLANNLAVWQLINS